MILRNCDFIELRKKLTEGSLFCFGAGKTLKAWSEIFGYIGWKDILGGIIDNNPDTPPIELFGRLYEVNDLKSLIVNAKKRKITILITSQFYVEIVKQLDEIVELDECECYIYHFMYNLPVESIDITDRKEYLIPPIIHYCWFGRGEKPDLYKKCIDSWYKNCPNYKIIEWNEDNCNIEENLYAKQAYECKKYGFVPDYFRLKIIYENGGIYLDTDIELLKNLDPLRNEEAFCGRQFPAEVAFGLGFGAKKHHKMIKYLMKTYEEMSFINEDGSYNLTASPYYQTRDLMGVGMLNDARLQRINGLCIYPPEVLSPINIFVGTKNVTDNAFSIHYYDGSWVDVEKKRRKKKTLAEAEQIYLRMSNYDEKN